MADNEMPFLSTLSDLFFAIAHYKCTVSVMKSDTW